MFVRMNEYLRSWWTILKMKAEEIVQPALRLSDTFDLRLFALHSSTSRSLDKVRPHKLRAKTIKISKKLTLATKVSTKAANFGEYKI